MNAVKMMLVAAAGALAPLVGQSGVLSPAYAGVTFTPHGVATYGGMGGSVWNGPAGVVVVNGPAGTAMFVPE